LKLSDQLGKILIGAGLSLAALGFLVVAAGKLTWLKLGRLPGDIHIERDGFSLYFPLTTMIILSVVGSLALFIIGRFRR
jgi:hypothetical protein